jgi:hypothetical protein
VIDLPARDVSQDASVSDVIQLTDGRYLAVGGDGNGVAWTSPDGETWSLVSNVPPLGPQEARGLGSVITVPGGILAYGLQGCDACEPYLTIVWSSTDGTSWRQVDPFSGIMLDLVVSPAGFIGVGTNAGLDNFNGPVAWTSGDGAQWAQTPNVPGSETAYLADLEEIADGWIAVGAERAIGENGPGQGLAWTTGDGLSWDLLPADPALADSALTSILAEGGRLTASGSIVVNRDEGLQHPAVWESDDGATWDQVLELDCCGYFLSLVRGQTGLIGLYYWYEPNAQQNGYAMLRRPDGGTWEMLGRPDVGPDISLRELAVAGGEVVGVGIRDQGNLYSPILLFPEDPL